MRSKNLGVILLVVFLVLLVGAAFLMTTRQSVFAICDKVPLDCSSDQSCRDLLRSAGISESDVASVVIECSSGSCTGQEPSGVCSRGEQA